mmetsp:Transcript_25366/g.35566  ORF Transcript_25366/g.35566 Transcript_25366/m.35566 type:complete len:88 (-) Transcript_25366:614-877(-)
MCPNPWKKNIWIMQVLIRVMTEERLPEKRENIIPEITNIVNDDNAINKIFYGANIHTLLKRLVVYSVESTRYEQRSIRSFENYIFQH